jgi:glycerophosphoryl diester phosphodiesterase
MLRLASIFPNRELLTSEWINKAHSRGLNIYPYTIDQQEDMLSIIRMGVDGIVTNRPDILKALIIS